MSIFKKLKSAFSRLGPGFVTGAADDDPSGVATYSIAGARFGYQLNWLSLFLIPMMFAIQEMAGRIGLCSGRGMAGVLKKYYSKKLLYFTVTLLVVANLINLSADLGIMAASLVMVLKFPFLFWLVVVTIFSIVLEIFIPYKKYSLYLKFMGLSLLVYVATAFITKQNWPEIIKNTLIPSLDLNLFFLLTVVGFVGTSISPYLFFWQANEEVEEEIADGKISDFNQKPQVYKKEINYLKKDTALGMIFSQIIAAAIVITTAATLHLNNITDIESPQQAALALRPLAGDLAYLLFAFGIIGIGLQSVPIFAGGIAYALSESLGFKEGLEKKYGQAKSFYFIIGLATAIGAVGNLIGINPVKALFYAAIINGFISVPLIFIILRLSDDERIVGKFKTGKKEKVIGWITFVFTLTALLLTLFSLFLSR